MEINAKADSYVVQSELFQEMSEERGFCDNTPDVKSKFILTPLYVPYKNAFFFLLTYYIPK